MKIAVALPLPLVLAALGHAESNIRIDDAAFATGRLQKRF
jgi:hypothetical protein